jgi:hypothetical protein
MTLANVVAAIPRFFREDVPWGEVATLPFAVFGMGFVCGALVGLLRGLSRRLGWVGDAMIGALVMVVFFLCCMACFDREMLLGRQPGREGMLLFAALTGLVVGPVIARDVKGESAPNPQQAPGDRAQPDAPADRPGD